ncbi:MAG: glycoside hydrolase family 32 protein [Anditalea sp.]
MKFVILGLFCTLIWGCGNLKFSQNKESLESEKHRPLFHHSPSKAWMNDPNGMVYLDGVYHLFYQFNPDSTVWGPMHWGHATSMDLVHWEEQDIALYPDSLGTIFSGSAVVDKDNTAGFGENALVAIFTHHNPQIEQEKTGKHQYQSIAYSKDKGKTWIKYEGNPVLPNPGIWDFRDPKVMWHEGTAQWIMTLATKQTITFYGSPDLKRWSRLSEFGEGIGVHDGVWECPDLISFHKEGKTIWALLVSINPGGPNGGSATQYFVGDFDGKTFTALDKENRWIDYGRDNYAGVTFSNTGGRRIFMGWMSNWDYANEVPTLNWRSANTLPRELDLQAVNDKWYITSNPVNELDKITEPPSTIGELVIRDSVSLLEQFDSIPKIFRLDFTGPSDKDFTVRLSNGKQEEVLIGYNAVKKEYFMDRTQAGNITFSNNFPSIQLAPRISKDDEVEISLFVDVASMELFADGGLTVMTDIFFPTEDFDNITLISDKHVTIRNLQLSAIRPTKDWPNSPSGKFEDRNISAFYK